MVIIKHMNELFCFVVFRDEKLSPKAADPAKKEARLFPDSSFSNSPHSAFLRQGNPQGE